MDEKKRLIQDRHTDRISQLLAQYARGELSDAERMELDQWLVADERHMTLFDMFSDGSALREALSAFSQPDTDTALQQLRDQIAKARTSTGSKTEIKRLWKWLPYAAALLIGMATATWYFFDNRLSEESEIVDLQEADIAPGGNRATLTLADGRTITLDEARDGIVIGDGEITYNDGNPLAVVLRNKDGQADTPLLELSTPKGGTYQIILSDGTRVWLNAASTLRYPPTFNQEEREVEIVGEAYFAVTEDENRPFRVLSEGQAVEVLGTAFNIAAYAQVRETKTTLVEGAVRLSDLDGGKTIDLSPGEQGILQEDGIKKINVDISAVTAWKFGRFSFDNKTFVEIMSEMARWYNIDIEYEGSAPDNRFIGDAYRTDNLRTVLRFLDDSSIQHRLDRGVDGRYRLVITSGKEGTD